MVTPQGPGHSRALSSHPQPHLEGRGQGHYPYSPCFGARPVWVLPLTARVLDISGWEPPAFAGLLPM